MHSHGPGKRLQRSKNRSPLANDRITLGLLVDWAIGDYQEAITRSVVLAAQKRDVNVLCFSGAAIAKPGAFEPRNAVYALPGKENVDALLIAAAGLGNVIGAQGVTEFCKRFDGVPIIAMTAELEGIPSLLVDNSAGMKALVSHLITTHRHRRIAFIRSSVHNVEDELRFQAYLSAHAEHGVEVHPELVASEEGLGVSGVRGIQMLVDERHIRMDTLDAIVCCNDSCATDVLHELERRGIRVPDDVAVTGFDDNAHVQYLNPPLTTVRQPLLELGAHAVQAAMDLVNGVTPKPRIELPTELVVRASCGCFSRSTETSNSMAALTGQRGSAEAALNARRSVVVAELARAARATLGAAGSGWEDRLFNAFVSDLTVTLGNSHLRALDQIMTRALTKDVDIRVVYDVTAALRRQVLAVLDPSSPERERAELMFHEATRLIADRLERVQVNRNIALKSRMTGLAGTMAGLSSWRAGPELGKWLAGRLPELEVGICNVAEFSDLSDPSKASLILAYDAAQGRTITRASGTFPTKNLIPNEITSRDRAVALLVVSLFFDERNLGFMMLDIGGYEPSTFYVLPAIVSAMLDHARTSAAQPPDT
jgi:phosphoserine phosphatase RsbU/P